MEKYIVNKETFILIRTNNITKIIEKNKVINIFSTPNIIMEESCNYYGSSLNGRIKGTYYKIGTKYKNPITISEENIIIFFPTLSYRDDECIWINLDAIKGYKNYDQMTEIILINNKKITIKISKKSFTNQLFKAMRLKSFFQGKK